MKPLTEEKMKNPQMPEKPATDAETPMTDRTSVECVLDDTAFVFKQDSPKKNVLLKCSFQGILTLLLIISVFTSGWGLQAPEKLLDLLNALVQITLVKGGK